MKKNIWLVKIQQFKTYNGNFQLIPVFEYAFDTYEEGHKFYEDTWKKFMGNLNVQVHFVGLALNEGDYGDIDSFIEEEFGT